MNRFLDFLDSPLGVLVLIVTGVLLSHFGPGVYHWAVGS